MASSYDPGTQPDLAAASMNASASPSVNVAGSLLMGVVGGLVAAIAGAVIWAAIVAVTKYQSGIVAIGVGALVGFAVRFFGRGQTPVFGVIGGVLSLVAVVLGNILAIAIIVSNDPTVGMTFTETLTFMLKSPDVTIQLLQKASTAIDLLFYAIAIYEGYRFATGRSFGRRRR